MGDDFFMDFSFFAHRFFVKNLWKFILQMGNPLGVYETNYKVKKVQNLSLGKIWPPSDLLFQEWSYCIYFEFFKNSSSDCDKIMKDCKYLGFSRPKWKQKYFLKKCCNWQFQIILFNPLYLVFIFAMKYFSLSFRTAWSELNIFSKTVREGFKN